MSYKNFVEEHIVATNKGLHNKALRSKATIEKEKAQFEALVSRAAQVLGIADIEKWKKDLGIAC